MDCVYYVYMYLKDNGISFYVGKGRPFPLKGRKSSEETKHKISEGGKGIVKLNKICLYCNRDIAVNTFNRFYGDNCKERIQDVIE